jgi:protein arginine kinase activator
MKCDACNENVATVHLTEIVHKKKKELHLCERCAQAKGVSVKAQFLPQEAEPAVPAKEIVAAGFVRFEELPAAACPVCGLTFGEFRATGRLGCANDYTVFKRGLTPLLEKIHGGTVEHRGKVPAHVNERLERQKKLAALRQALNKAIQKEEYEEAAQLRDRIRELEEKT